MFRYVLNSSTVLGYVPAVRVELAALRSHAASRPAGRGVPMITAVGRTGSVALAGTIVGEAARAEAAISPAACSTMSML